MIKVKVNDLKNAMSELDSCKRAIQRQSEEIRNGVSIEGLNKISPALSRKLKEIEEQLQEESGKIFSLKQALERISVMYNRTEHTVEQYAEHARIQVVKQEIGQNDTTRYIDMLHGN